MAVTLVLFGTGCESASFEAIDEWSGTMDTLATGEVVVRNTDVPLWSSEEVWQVVEETRIGSDPDNETSLFGSIHSFDVDSQGQVFVLDEQTQEIRVFDSHGAFIRTVGGRGNGPGEFTEASAVDISRNGEIWVMEMILGRLSILNADGALLRTEHIGGSSDFRMSIWPYPGGFDPLGRYNAVLVTLSEEGTTQALARFDQSFTPLDTIPIPEESKETEYFSLVSEDGGSTMRLVVPFQGSLEWRFSPSGNLWTLVTDKYELVELNDNEEALRRVTKEYEPLEVTEAEMEEMRARLARFINQGMKVDWSKVAKTKPVTVSFFCDDEGNFWVNLEAATPEDDSRLFDLFDPEGRYLGAVRLPFSLRSNPEPIVRDDILYGITTDDLGAENVVIARIKKSQTDLLH